MTTTRGAEPGCPATLLFQLPQRAHTTDHSMSSRARSPSVEFLSSTIAPLPRSPSVEFVAITNAPAKTASAGASAKVRAVHCAFDARGLLACAARRKAKVGRQRRACQEADEKICERRRRRAGPRAALEIYRQLSPRDVRIPFSFSRSLSDARLSSDLKGTKIAAHNCGGTFFKSSAKARLSVAAISRS